MIFPSTPLWLETKTLVVVMTGFAGTAEVAVPRTIENSPKCKFKSFAFLKCRATIAKSLPLSTFNALAILNVFSTHSPTSMEELSITFK